jgi:hypothetical protein
VIALVVLLMCSASAHRGCVSAGDEADGTGREGRAVPPFMKAVIWIVAFLGAYLAVRLLRGL